MSDVRTNLFFRPWNNGVSDEPAPQTRSIRMDEQSGEMVVTATSADLENTKGRVSTNSRGKENDAKRHASIDSTLSIPRGEKRFENSSNLTRRRHGRRVTLSHGSSSCSGTSRIGLGVFEGDIDVSAFASTVVPAHESSLPPPSSTLPIFWSTNASSLEVNYHQHMGLYHMVGLPTLSVNSDTCPLEIASPDIDGNLVGQTNGRSFCYGYPNVVMDGPCPLSIQQAAEMIRKQEGALKAMKKMRPKRFRCEHCDVAFSNNGQLKGHIRIHTGERPFKCDAEGCEKTFTRNEELTRHKRIHTGIRPHACPVCGKCFGRKDHLKKHMKTHENRDIYARSAAAALGMYALGHAPSAFSPYAFHI